MSIEEKKLYKDNLTNTLADDKLDSFDDFVPESVKIKSIEDLRQKLAVGLKDVEEGRVYSAEEVFSRLDNK